MTAPEAGSGHRVSVLVAARDAEQTLAATLDSLSRQTLPAYEVLVVDDGSTDRTAAIAADGGARVIVSEANGLASARNLGLLHAEGDIIAVVDADDVFSPDHLAAGLELLDSASADAVAVDAWYWVQGRVAPFTHFGSSRPPTVLTETDLLTGNPLLSTCFVRTEALRSVQGYDSRLDALEDYDLWLRLVEQGFRVVPARAATMWYRREGGMTADAGRMYAALGDVLAARCERLGITTEAAPVVAHAAVGSGNWALLSGDPTAAREHWGRARALGDRRRGLQALTVATRVAPRLAAGFLRRRLTAAGRPLPGPVAAWWRRDGHRQVVVSRPDLAAAR